MFTGSDFLMKLSDFKVNERFEKNPIITKVPEEV